MDFEPIAIVGQSCVLPGALNPRELIDLVLEGKDVLSTVPEGYWRTDPSLVLTDSPKTAQDQTWCDKGGYVRGFESIFDPEGFAISQDEVMQHDPIVHWLLHTAREALKDAGYLFETNLKTGLIFGNLSYPSHGVTQFAEAVWLDSQDNTFLNGKARELAGIKRPHALNRFMSGLPAHVVAKALKLKGEAFALDAACASSLYAIKLACDQLHDRKADMMLAGGINRADDLIIHIGFCVLKAMSITGQSRPFHKDADGLVPTEGAGLIALKRLDDAVAAGDTIHGVIRGVGLANDARGKGLLVPSAEGQARAMRAAYDMSGLNPSDISLLECHATGTTVGDGIEVKSTAEIFQGLKDVPLGTIKSNMGHPITVSGIAGILKVTGAMKAGIRPKTLHAEEPLEVLKNSPFRLLTENEPWEAASPRRAGISNFGFGGNNAHLIVEEWVETSYKPSKKQVPLQMDEIVIVGMGAIVADAVGKDAFTKALFAGDSRLRDQEDGIFGGFTEEIDLPMLGLNFPPADLKQTLPQQLIMLKATMEAISEVDKLPRERTCLFAGMGCDAEISRGAMGWKMKQLVQDWTGKKDLSKMEEWISNAKAQINPYGKAPAVLGAMPNIVANRLSSQFDIGGPGFSVSSEELSGITALNLAIRALRTGEMDAAIVGAVDISCEQVHNTAAKEVLSKEKQIPGDAAISLILKRREDAIKDGDTIYAVFSDEIETQAGVSFGSGKQHINLESIFGHAHAASGLVYIAAAALSCHHQVLPNGKNEMATPWYGLTDSRTAEVSVNALYERSATIRVKQDNQRIADPLLIEETPNIHIYSGTDRKDVLKHLDAEEESNQGPARLVIVATSANLSELQHQAQAILNKGDFKGLFSLDKGIYYCDKPIDGELAFVFTGSGGVYQGMGRELLMAFPEVLNGVEKRFSTIGNIARWLYNPKNGDIRDPEKMLWASSFLSQIHAEISQKILGLTPGAALGFSSGESNSLFALGAWNDMDDMAREFHDMGVFSREVGGEFASIRKAWKKHDIQSVNWTNWHIRAQEHEVVSALEPEPLVHLIIKNSPKEMVIGGQQDACDRVIAKIGSNKAIPLTYNVANHCPELEVYKDDWRKLHCRKTTSVPDVRFYTGATCSHYKPTADTAADAILGMATQMLDFPKMVENAWNDGVRIFLEHGPSESCSRWIKDTLGDRKHIAIPMDKSGRPSVMQLVHTAAQLLAAGISINYKAITNRKMSMKKSSTPAKSKDNSPLNKTITYKVHPPMVTFPPIDQNQTKSTNETAQGETIQLIPKSGDNMPASHQVTSDISQVMAPAPSLPSVMEKTNQADNTPEKNINHVEKVQTQPVQPQPVQIDKQATPVQPMNTPDSEILNVVVNQNAMISSAHREFLDQSTQIHQRFLEQRKNTLSILMNALGQVDVSNHDQFQPAEQEYVPFEQPETEIQPDSAVPSPGEAYSSIPQMTVNEEPVALKQDQPKPPPEPVKPVFVKPKVIEQPSADLKKKDTSTPKKPTAMDALRRQFENPVAIEPTGPSYSKEQLHILASGKISDVFGPLFEQQDDYEIQVRLPEPPLLLADRITGIDAEPGSMGKGIMWTETDVTEGAWYLHDMYMPGGITIESGQCDLSLISYLGIDFLNKGERAYRLLGCDLMYYGAPPKVGETLCYQIHVDGHTNMGGQRMFFFHYDCRVNGKLRLSVRNGQAAFITPEEAKNAGGVLWSPETGEHKPLDEVRLDPPEVICTRNRFSKEQVQAFSKGRAYECFGEGFEILASHSKTPKIPSGMMCLLHEVTDFNPKGGPWKRGYIRVENKISPDDWFLPGHFKNDPCMPGTLMSDACMQTLAFYLAAMGFTIKRDGWRFDPVPDEVYQAKCRAQITPESKDLVYE
ncbi:MAG: beta-ketoacyl synthase, partial [Desulfobacterales bacterium]|nr:beta-ketoacyl synthase [Desulfobacterales bacterium]